ncbi:MazG-like pyrophosphatase [Erwinia phage vB_EamM-Bue1]|uniref:Uncharacterized protein n=1 Tax=Erwinia phage vB_EamM-Bue1 TaxID=2099338 RepID=A0A2P1JUB6_9CAUD|nr:MazG-like pyrophosphatase [Erwinia phage vB_EamM-Bue1]AVO22946.1 hypothetical protein [Erwinia phage vB_EamM-Bue1]
MKTTFQKVSELNEAFGNPKGDILNPNVPAIRKQAELVLEEAIELMEAAYPGSKIFWQWDITAEPPEHAVGVNMKEILDAQGDVTTVNDGMGHIAGFNGDQVLSIVDRSNRTKFIPDVDSVEPALNYYYDLGFDQKDLRIEGEFPLVCIKVTRDVQIGSKKYPAGKFLKNMATFQEPDFSDILAGKGWDFGMIVIDGKQETPASIGGVLYGTEEYFQELWDNAVVVDTAFETVDENTQLNSAMMVVEFKHATADNGLTGQWLAFNMELEPSDMSQVEGDLSALGLHGVTEFIRF